MEITIREDGETRYVDFKAPTYLYDDVQKKAFKEFFKRHHPDIEIVDDVPEKEKKYTAREQQDDDHSWTTHDYWLLLDWKKTEKELATEIGVSDMAIILKRGYFVRDFNDWMRRKGYTDRTPSRVGEFMGEQP